MESKGKPAPAGLSIRNGPVDDDAMDVDAPQTNGKRKSRSSIVSISYKDDSGSEDDKPLVRCHTTRDPSEAATDPHCVGEETEDQAAPVICRDGSSRFGRR